MKRILTVMFVAAALLTGGLVAQPQPETRWQYVGTTRVDTVYIDRETVTYRPADSPDYVVVWVDFVSKDGGYMLAHYQYHRSDRHMRVLSAVSYDADGRIVNSGYTSTGWTAVVPGSVAEGSFYVLFPGMISGINGRTS
jgi:hypothetical protein